MLTVNPSSGVPVYRQLMDQIRLFVASGVLKPGDELPSTRALSSQLGINPMTISKAYSYLENEGTVTRRPGRPLVVSPLNEEQVRTRKIDQLRESLGPIVAMIRQLGIGDERALQLLREMLSGKPDPGGKEERE